MKGHTNTKKKEAQFVGGKKIFDCPVSKASVEIMLDRVCNGKSIDFPFSNN